MKKNGNKRSNQQRLLSQINKLLAPDKHGNNPIVTIQRFGDEYRLGRISNQGIIRDENNEQHS